MKAYDDTGAQALPDTDGSRHPFGGGGANLPSSGHRFSQKATGGGGGGVRSEVFETRFFPCNINKYTY